MGDYGTNLQGKNLDPFETQPTEPNLNSSLQSSKKSLYQSKRKPQIVGNQYKQITQNLQNTLLQKQLEEEQIYLEKLQKSSQKNKQNKYKNSDELFEHSNYTNMIPLNQSQQNQQQQLHSSILSKYSTLPNIMEGSIQSPELFQQPQDYDILNNSLKVDKIQRKKARNKPELAKYKNFNKMTTGISFKSQSSMSSNTLQTKYGLFKNQQLKQKEIEQLQAKNKRKHLNTSKSLDLNQEKFLKTKDKYYNLKQVNFTNYQYEQPTIQMQQIFDQYPKKSSRIFDVKRKKINESTLLETSMSNIRVVGTMKKECDDIDMQGGVVKNWKNKLMEKQIDKKKKITPLVEKEFIQKNLKKLEETVIEKNNKNAQKGLQDQIQKLKRKEWLPPLQKYDQQLDKIILQKQQNQQDQSQNNNSKTSEIFLNVLNLNHAFEGAQSSLHSYFDNHPIQHQSLKKLNDRKTQINKKYKSNLIIEEFNKMIQIDDLNRLQNQKQIQKIQKKKEQQQIQQYQQQQQYQYQQQAPFDNDISEIQNQNNYSQSNATQNFPSFIDEVDDSVKIAYKIIQPATFTQSQYYQKYIRQDDSNITQRVLYALQISKAGLTLDSLKTLFQIFILKDADYFAKQKFLARYFYFNTKDFCMLSFITQLKNLCKIQISSIYQNNNNTNSSNLENKGNNAFHEQLIEQSGLLFEKFQNLMAQQYDIYDVDDILDIERIEEIFFNEVLDVNDIIALICRQYYQQQ